MGVQGTDLPIYHRRSQPHQGRSQMHLDMPLLILDQVPRQGLVLLLRRPLVLRARAVRIRAQELRLLLVQDRRSRQQ